MRARRRRTASCGRFEALRSGGRWSEASSDLQWFVADLECIGRELEKRLLEPGPAHFDVACGRETVQEGAKRRLAVCGREDHGVAVSLNSDHARQRVQLRQVGAGKRRADRLA